MKSVVLTTLPSMFLKYHKSTATSPVGMRLLCMDT